MKKLEFLEIRTLLAAYNDFNRDLNEQSDDANIIVANEASSGYSFMDWLNAGVAAGIPLFGAYTTFKLATNVATMSKMTPADIKGMTPIFIMTSAVDGMLTYQLFQD